MVLSLQEAATRRLLSAVLHDSALNDDAACHILPEGNQELARQRDDRALAPAFVLRLLMERARQSRLPLMA